MWPLPSRPSRLLGEADPLPPRGHSLPPVWPGHQEAVAGLREPGLPPGPALPHAQPHPPGGGGGGPPGPVTAALGAGPAGFPAALKLKTRESYGKC